MKTLKERFDAIANEYVKSFCKMYGFDALDAYWIGSDVGGILDLEDYTFNFDDIRYCVDNKVKWSCLIKWYDYNMDNGKVRYINLNSWVKGCPKPSNKELERLKKEMEEGRNKLMEEIKK